MALQKPKEVASQINTQNAGKKAREPFTKRVT
jgi:hypothetical protein